MRLGGAAAHAIRPPRGLEGPRANQRTHARMSGSTCAARNAGSSRLEQFRMQFDWVNFQQYLQTLQFQRYGRAVRHGVGGIACDIHGKLTGRESCATTRSTAGSAATSAPVARQRPDTVDTVAANDLPKPHRDRSRDHAQARDETTTSNTDFPVLAGRKLST